MVSIQARFQCTSFNRSGAPLPLSGKPTDCASKKAGKCS
jgi:hypothetical protein